MARILVIDDDADFSEYLRSALEQQGHDADWLEGAEGVRERLAGAKFDLLLLDNRMPGLSGVELLAELKRWNIAAPVVLMTGSPNSKTAIRAMNLGAFDYVVKPLDTAELARDLEPIIAKALELSAPNKRPVRLPGQGVNDDAPGPQLRGNSPQMNEVYKLIGLFAGSDAPVLILGETGTGKELAAKAIHDNSPRKDRPFVALNCTALNENLLDDELFGHEPKSFSGAGDKLRKGRFEYANGGTLFLDEVGDMPPMLQAKLLRVLESKELVRVGGNEPISVDVRVVSATHRDLRAAIEEQRFRQDLYFRLSGLTILLPPLRERGPDDLRELIEYFLAQAAQAGDRPVPSLHEAAWKQMLQHSWPGNIRELRDVICRAVLMCRGGEILPEHLDLQEPERTAQEGEAAGEHVETGLALRRWMQWALRSGQADLYQHLFDQFERELLQLALAEYGGNQVQTAKRLGLSRNGLRSKMKTHGLDFGG